MTNKRKVCWKGRKKKTKEKKINDAIRSFFTPHVNLLNHASFPFASDGL